MDQLTIAMVILHLLMMAPVLFVAVRRIVTGNHALPLILFSFALATALISNIYWMAYDLLRPDQRMPFAANEIGECAMFLLLGSSLTTLFSHPRPAARAEKALAILFIGANTAFWIVWSGEWIQDILTGISMAYFFCCLVVVIRQTGALRGPDGIAVGFSCLSVVVLQTIGFFVPADTVAVFDVVCFGLFLACFSVCSVRAVLALRAEESGGIRQRAVPLSFLSLAVSVIAMYMSTGIYYLVMFVLASIAYILILVSLLRKGVVS